MKKIILVGDMTQIKRRYKPDYDGIDRIVTKTSPP